MLNENIDFPSYLLNETLNSWKNFYLEMHSYADRLQNTSIAKRLVILAI